MFPKFENLKKNQNNSFVFNGQCANLPELNTALLIHRIFTPATPHRVSYWSCSPALQPELKTHGSQHLARKHPWVFTIKLLKNAQIYIFYKNIYTHTHIKTERWIIIKRTWIIWNYYVSETSRKWIQEYISLQTKKCVPLIITRVCMFWWSKYAR